MSGGREENKIRLGAEQREDWGRGEGPEHWQRCVPADRSCRTGPTSTGARPQPEAWSRRPTRASHIWVSLHNVLRGETLECGSVRALCSFPALRSAAASLFSFMSFLGVCAQIRSRTGKKKRISEGKVKIPQGSIFLLCLLYSGEVFFFFFHGISSPSVLFREVNTTWTRCAPGLFAAKSGPPDGVEGEGE